jgi:hypothetical protein
METTGDSMRRIKKLPVLANTFFISILRALA